MRILVVEDDATLRRFLRLILEEEGFVVDSTGRAEEGRALALTNDYDAIIIDLTLPDGNGVDVVKAIRAEGRVVPIMVFTGRAESEEIIKALDAGADDYLTKPTDASLIHARVRALVRRGQLAGVARGGPLEVGNISLNVSTRRTDVAGVRLELTPKEFLLLQHFMLHVGEAVTRSELLEKVWDMHFDPQSSVVDTHVSRLRSKLKKAGASAALVGVRGAGFMLEQENGALHNASA